MLVFGASGNRLVDLRVSRSTFSGVIVADASHTRIVDVMSRLNGLSTDQAGITLIASQWTRIAEVVVTSNGDIGLFAAEANNSRIVDSVFADHFEAGIVLEGSDNRVIDNAVRRNGDGVVLVGDRNVIRDNRVTDTLGCAGECGFAITFEGGSGNLMAANKIARTLWGIRLDAFAGPATDTVLRGNVVRDASLDGIAVDMEQVGPVTGTLLQHNLVTGSGDDGIDVSATDTTLARNVANHNGDLGIEAVDGVIDGGHNRAAGNGNPLQCTGVSC
jgi:parallel beta-helix repeat protein